jgi:hypothetical protein
MAAAGLDDPELDTNFMNRVCATDISDICTIVTRDEEDYPEDCPNWNLALDGCTFKFNWEQMKAFVEGGAIENGYDDIAEICFTFKVDLKESTLTYGVTHVLVMEFDKSVLLSEDQKTQLSAVRERFAAILAELRQ